MSLILWKLTLLLFRRAFEFIKLDARFVLEPLLVFSNGSLPFGSGLLDRDGGDSGETICSEVTLFMTLELLLLAEERWRGEDGEVGNVYYLRGRIAFRLDRVAREGDGWVLA